MVIVPEQATFRMERDIISACHLPGLFNVSVVSFDRLVHEILNTCGGRNLAPLDFIGKTMVVRSLLDTYRDELSVFGKSSAMPGFEIKMTEMLTELKRQDVGLDDLEKAPEMQLAPITQEKITDISLLYSAYYEKLKGQHLDSEDLIALATEKAEGQNFFSGATVFVDGFDLLTHQLLQLLMTAVSQAVSTTISIKRNEHPTHDEKAFQAEETLYFRISEAANKLGIKPKEVYLSAETLDKTKYRSEELLHLEQNLFAYPYTVYKDTPKDIQLSALDSQALEVTQTCAQMIDLIGSGYRFRDMAICVSDIDAYRESLAFALKENNIPYFMDAKTKLMDTAFAEFIISLLDFILYKDTADFLVHIKSGFLAVPDDDLFAVENYIRRYQLKGYTLNYAFKHSTPDTEKARKQLTNPVFELMRSLKSAQTAESYGEDVLTYLQLCQVDQTVEALAKDMEEQGDLAGAQVFAQIFEKIVEIIRQACVMFGGGEIAFDSFVSAIKAGLEAVEIAVIPPSTDDVLVGDFSRTVFPAVKALFILGLNDGKIPASPDASAILTDDEKQVLEKKGLRAGYRDRFFEERLRIYTVFSKPTEKLYLSFTNSAEKDTAKPSVLVGRMQKLFPALTPKISTPRESVSLSLCEESLFRGLSLSINQKLEGLAISDTWRDVYAYFNNQPHWQPRLSRVTRVLKTESKAESIDAHLAETLYTPLKASISRVERYYACPMKYFFDYGIKPQKDERFEETPLEMGNFLHACLHGFVQAAKKEKTEWGDFADDRLTLVAEAVCERVRKTHNQGILAEKALKPIYERLKLDFLSAVRTIRDQLSGTEVKVFAAEFKLDNAEYLNFTLENGVELKLTCKVDRVDVLNTGAASVVRIIDYKLSGKTASLKDVYYGLNIQLLIYLKFVAEYFKAQGENVILGGAFYYDLSLPLSDNISPENLLKEKRMNGYLVDDAALNETLSKLNGSNLVATQGSVTKSGGLNKRTKTIFTAEQFDALFNHCENVMKQAFLKILSGDITPLPYKSGSEVPCDYCDYKSICLFDADLDAYRHIEEKDITDFGWKE